MHPFRYSLLFAATGAIAACSDARTTAAPAGRLPTAPAAAIPQIAVLECVARPAARSISCEPGAKPGTASADLILGGQGQYVTLASSNVGYSAGVFSFDATVQSLIPQPLGTSDGASPDTGGVKVFFASEPTVTGGAGLISVANPDGVGAFTGSNQPYYKYANAALGVDGILSKNETSGSKTWQITVDPGVTSFTFKVFVSAVVQHPKGYVNMSTDTTVYAPSDSAYALPTETRTFAAQVVTGAGLPVRSAAIAWTSSNPSIATVDETGTVTAVAPGTVTISAQSDTLVSRATVSVCPNLAVGSAYVTGGPSAASICLMNTSSGAAEYVVVPSNGSSSSSVAMTFTAGGIQAVTGPPSPNLVPNGGLFPAASNGAATADAQFAFEQSLRRGLPSLASLRNRGPRSFAANRRATPVDSDQGVTTTSGARTRLMWYVAPSSAEPNGNQIAAAGAEHSIAPGVPAIGDLMNLDVTAACGGAPSVRVGRVRTISQHAIIVSDTANPAGGFVTAQYDSIGAEFDSISYRVDSANFGNPSDADANGRIVIFYTRAVNELGPPASSVYPTAFFAPKDLFPRDPVGCPTSNEGEIIYMMVPDPTGAVNSNVRTVPFTRGQSPLQLTHQLEHLINASRRVYVTGASVFEDPWLDEGLAGVAQELAFYRMSVGLAPRGNIVLSNLNSGPNASRRVAAFNTYANDLLSTRLRPWLQRPDTTGPLFHTPKSDYTGGGSVAAPGALWAFLRYASDRVNGSDAAFWSTLVNSNLEGTANIQNAIGGADPIAWARDFAAAMYADDNGFTVTAPYQTPSWNFRSVYGGLGGFLLLARPLTNNTPLALSISYGGGSSYLRLGVAASGKAVLKTTTTGSIPSTFGMTVVRTK